MSNPLIHMQKTLPAIPAKRYFTIGEVSELCGVKPYVLRYWEQEFAQLRPMKRRGNRRYYQHHEVLLVRRIRELLYDQGFTIHGARSQLAESRGRAAASVTDPGETPADGAELATEAAPEGSDAVVPDEPAAPQAPPTLSELRDELTAIRALLSV